MDPHIVLEDYSVIRYWEDKKIALPFLVSLLESYKYSNDQNVLEQLWFGVQNFTKNLPSDHMLNAARDVNMNGTQQEESNEMKVNAPTEAVCETPKLIQMMVTSLDAATKRKRIPTSLCQHLVRSIGNILAGNHDQTRKVLECDYLTIVSRVLLQQQNNETRNETLLTEILWTVSNIMIGTQQQLQTVLDDKTLVTSIMMQAKSGHTRSQTHAIWCIANGLSTANAAQVASLVNSGAIQGLVGFLYDYNHEKTQGLIILLEALEKILDASDDQHDYASRCEESGAVKKLDELQSHEDLPEEIYKKAELILRKFSSKHLNQDIEMLDNSSNNCMFANPVRDASGRIIFGNGLQRTKNSHPNTFEF